MRKIILFMPATTLDSSSATMTAKNTQRTMVGMGSGTQPPLNKTRRQQRRPRGGVLHSGGSKGSPGTALIAQRRRSRRAPRVHPGARGRPFEPHTTTACFSLPNVPNGTRDQRRGSPWPREESSAAKRALLPPQVVTRISRWLRVGSSPSPSAPPITLTPSPHRREQL